MARLIVHEAGEVRVVPLGTERVMVGRAEETDVRIDDAAASRRHCVVEPHGNGYVVRDLGSKNGTFISRTRVEAHELEHGDEIVIGHVRIRFDAEPIGLEEESALPAGAAAEEKGAAPVAPAQFVLVFSEQDGSKRRFELVEPVISIGRHNSNSVVLANEAVSNHHCELRRREDGAHEIIDLGSKNGTWVNGEPVRRHLLVHGDDLTVGGVLLRYRKIGEPEPQRPSAAPLSIPEATVSALYGAPPTSALTVALYILVGVIVLAGGAFAAYQYVRTTRTRPPAPTGNLVRENPSFEDQFLESSTIPGWTLWAADGDRVTMDSTSAADGKQAARIDLAPDRDATAPARLISNAPHAVSAGDTCELTAQARRVRGESGWAAVQVVLHSSRHSDVRVLYTSPLRKVTDTWSTVRLVFSVPSWADRAHVGCVAYGRSLATAFDNVSLRLIADAKPLPTLALPQMSVTVGPGGQFTIVQQGQPVIWSAFPALFDATGRMLSRPDLCATTEFVGLSDGSLVVRPAFLDLSTGEVVDTPFIMTAASDALQITLPAVQSLGRPVASLGLAWECSSSHLRNGVALSFQDTHAQYRRPFAATPGVRAVSLDGADSLHILFQEPGELSAVQQDGGAVRVVARWTSPTVEPQVAVRTHERRLVAQVERLLRDAANDEAQGRLGSALNACQMVLAQAFYLQGPAEEARARIQRLRSVAEADLKAVAESFQRARVTLNDEDFADAAARGERLARAFEGTEFGQRAQALLQDVDNSRTRAHERRTETEASRLLEQGRAFLQGGQVFIARHFFETVTEKFPNTEWSRIAEETLDQIELHQDAGPARGPRR